MVRGEQYIYMATANDRLETPLYVAETASEMAAFLGCSISSLHARICRQKNGERSEKKNTAIKVYSFRKEDDDD